LSQLRVKVVCATRESPERFYTATATGRSLALYRVAPSDVLLYANNKRGLPAVYNEAIDACARDPAVLLFVHDDVHLCDFYWQSKLLQALGRFDVVGLAGNKRRVPRQPAWAFVDDKLTWDGREHLSGVVGHGKGFPPGNLSIFGQPGKQVKLLDGVFLAARSSTLVERGVRFDERFAFHLYDMDFCRSCEAAALQLGTWSISLIHESGGNFGSPSWRAAYAAYLEKWGE
jgi:GT2 family glycosyltransferase